jgi:hypothetical protein
MAFLGSRSVPRTVADARVRSSAVALPVARLRRLWAPLLASLLVTALVVWVFRRQIFDYWSFPWDFIGSYSTTPAFVAASIGRGHPLAWSPFVASGFPVDVDPQAGVYFPLWWLLGALHIPLTDGALMNVQVAHVLAGALGVMCLARARRMQWMWAAVAAVAYVFFGGYYGQAEHADIFRGFAYLPWLLWSLTPPSEPRRWWRLAAFPIIMWVIATGGYPGQLVSFAIAGAAYAAIALGVQERVSLRHWRIAIVLAALAALAVCLAVLLPYLRAVHTGELLRPTMPTVQARAENALAPLDLLGLYLNNFAWDREGTILTWAVGVPVLVGLAYVRRESLARHAPLVAVGALALALAMAPKVGFAGRAMLSLKFLFPSRFPASEYKAVVALALIILSADAWSRLWSRRRRPWGPTAIVVALLAAGALLAPSTYGQPTRELWLVLLVIAASGALALLRPNPRVLACALVVLVVVDGMREINDYLLGAESPWQPVQGWTGYLRERDEYVRRLPSLLAAAPATRPARVPRSQVPQVNALGWVADGYQVTDYSSLVEAAQWNAEHNPAWLGQLLAPWHAVIFPCAEVGCTGASVHLPPASAWKVSASVRTTAYRAQEIAYQVRLTKPAVMVENELAIAGWHAHGERVRSVKSGTPFRAWRLPAGSYDFTTSFQEPGRPLQELVAACALVAWLGCLIVIRVGRSRSSRAAK